MTVDDTDPVQRWQKIATWYADFADKRGWEFLRPMVGITAWISEQVFAERLYASTSHEYLCVFLAPGFPDDRPFFSCCTTGDGQFMCELWARVGKRIDKQVVTLTQARSVVAHFADKLMVIAASAVPEIVKHQPK